MNWLRQRLGVAEPTPPPVPVDADSPAALHAALLDLVRFVNRNAGQLPAGVVVRIRHLTDTLSEIIDTSEVRPLDVYAVISIKTTTTDYLPTSVRRYLALPAPQREAVHASVGKTATESLLEQVAALQSSADKVLLAARNDDTDALMTQGAFLRTKFSGSDLDL